MTAVGAVVLKPVVAAVENAVIVYRETAGEKQLLASYELGPNDGGEAADREQLHGAAASESPHPRKPDFFEPVLLTTSRRGPARSLFSAAPQCVPNKMAANVCFHSARYIKN